MEVWMNAAVEVGIEVEVGVEVEVGLGGNRDEDCTGRDSRARYKVSLPRALSALVVYSTIRVARLLPPVKNPSLSKLAATCPKADHRAVT